jgi:hypothetical protein
VAGQDSAPTFLPAPPLTDDDVRNLVVAPSPALFGKLHKDGLATKAAEFSVGVSKSHLPQGWWSIEPILKSHFCTERKKIRNGSFFLEILQTISIQARER